MTTFFDRAFLLRLFAEVDEEVGERIGEHVLIIGGAALIFAGMERGTEDVDSVSRLPPGPLVEAIGKVGRRHNLPPHWLNDGALVFATEDLSICNPRPVFEGRNIKVFIPDLPFLLATKLRSARLQDQEDALWLMGQTGITVKGALLGLVEWAFPNSHITEHEKRFIGAVAELFRR